MKLQLSKSGFAVDSFLQRTEIEATVGGGTFSPLPMAAFPCEQNQTTFNAILLSAWLQLAAEKTGRTSEHFRDSLLLKWLKLSCKHMKQLY